ncbi:hypothetical protein GCM10009678_55570 [Actinomadura kijaniata]|uniref:Uncharacterized protein n=1 Tax=Actinomadura namibiensis TaxID=182080 RepID=A0A7W3LLA1_ACTNM|nr:hypothetical protein [Actinomadura namibiensis]MBA8950226.1 hypothetical protein [Actinomadura namibiensis]
MLRRLGYYALAITLIFFALRDPNGAARVVKATFGFLMTIADGLSRFASAF